MSIRITNQAANYDYGYTVASSASSSSSSSSYKPTKAPPTPSLTASSLVPAIAPIWGEPEYQYHSQVNEYENAAPPFPNPDAPNPTMAELSNASSYISYLAEQLNVTKDKLEKAEEKIKMLENNDIKEYKEYIISSIDEFLASRTNKEAMSGREIFEKVIN